MIDIWTRKNKTHNKTGPPSSGIIHTAFAPGCGMKREEEEKEKKKQQIVVAISVVPQKNWSRESNLRRPRAGDKKKDIKKGFGGNQKSFAYQKEE